MKRGAQPHNQNARRTHTRLAVSFSGALLDRVYEQLAARGTSDPTPEQIKLYIRMIVQKATS